ncbi:hypothetical protein [Pseudooceanicola sp. LIPI14-2-Ac024]|uniref:hypothetical protein n=1 Tax=Pseudooceanicola sp. LIPI14-2-Ac024 TaxID=3344875 RepID=UPI0035D08989
MTALSQYQRLEARGLWRENAEAQRREVVVSLGDATLILTDLSDRALAHWSLAAVERLNPGETPALYSPDGLEDEVLELPEDETEMVSAIERVRRAVESRRPHPGRLRFGMIGAIVVVVAALALFWLPGALSQHALSVVPRVKREAIGEALMARLQTVTGPVCADRDGRRALDALARRLPGVNGPPDLFVVRDGVRGAAHLPGGIVLLNRSVVEDTSDPDVVAGYVIAELLRARRSDPLGDVLRAAGPVATVRLLTTGALPEEALDNYARTVLTDPPVELPDEALITGFKDHRVRSSAYAYARDISGESTLTLIEADPYAEAPAEPVLSDANWLRLQAICER